MIDVNSKEIFKHSSLMDLEINRVQISISLINGVQVAGSAGKKVRSEPLVTR